MISSKNPYNAGIPELGTLQGMTEVEIEGRLEEYLQNYKGCFVRIQQRKYFDCFVKGLLSNLDRKSIEPIALSFLGEKDVRGMQQFFTRSKGWEAAVSNHHKSQLAMHLNTEKGFLSVDESDFEKKGKKSVGVARQYCGRLGKTENCQAGVFVSYATEKGMGLVDSRLYLPDVWFGEDYEEKRKDCQVPEGTLFKTKNQIAKDMLGDVLRDQLFEVECVGCDASFGSDHTFLDGLSESVHYFASVRENERIFREMPQVIIPGKSGGRSQYKHPRAMESPVQIKTILDDESVPWVTRVIAEGAKGPVIAEIKCLRCVSCRKENRLYVPKGEIWVYIRKHEDGTIKYFVSNKPPDTETSELDRLATARWSIEQCFQECKSHLGMTHYETRSYPAWHRHMLLVMVAQLFVAILRSFLKKACPRYHADGTVYHSRADSDPDKAGTGADDCSLSLAA